MPHILITGGTGTFGRAFIRAAIESGRYDRIVSLSRDEQKVASVNEEFGSFPGFRAFIGDVRDRDRLRDACRGIDTVIAAAALKRVDSTCYNPDELYKTNVAGVDNTIRAAADCGVQRVLVVSSDKACAPTNPYGVSKAMAESCSTSANVWAYPRGTRISVVRYGNVLGSRGSVIGIWKSQLAARQPLTITDHRMTRFVLTIEQAVAFSERALACMEGGEIFVPVLPSAEIPELARAVGGERCGIVETGLRPGGEKLAEALLNEEEPSRTVVRDGMYVITPSHHEWRATPFEGPRLPADFVYRSDANRRWLDSDALRILLTTTETYR